MGSLRRPILRVFGQKLRWTGESSLSFDYYFVQSDQSGQSKLTELHGTSDKESIHLEVMGKCFTCRDSWCSNRWKTVWNGEMASAIDIWMTTSRWGMSTVDNKTEIEGKRAIDWLYVFNRLLEIARHQERWGERNTRKQVVSGQKIAAHNGHLMQSEQIKGRISQEKSDNRLIWWTMWVVFPSIVKWCGQCNYI